MDPTHDLLSSLGALALGSRMKRISDRLMQDGIRVYRDSGLTFEPRWFPVYYFLSRNGPSGVTEIARGLGVSHPSVNQIAREMINASVIATYKDMADRRKRVLALTRQGKLLLPALEAVWRDIRSALGDVVGEAGPDFLAGLDAIERALDDQGFHQRFRARHDPDAEGAILIAAFNREAPADTADFRSLNLAWIEDTFEVEASDRRMLDDPVAEVIEPGGQILIARDAGSGKALGTCAIVNHGDGVLELAKMTVATAARGRGIGKLIGRAAITLAKERSATTLYLETSSKLAPALQLYRELGFRQLPSPFDSDYVRADIYMAMKP